MCSCQEKQAHTHIAKRLNNLYDFRDVLGHRRQTLRQHQSVGLLQGSNEGRPEEQANGSRACSTGEQCLGRIGSSRGVRHEVDYSRRSQAEQRRQRKQLSRSVPAWRQQLLVKARLRGMATPADTNCHDAPVGCGGQQPQRLRLGEQTGLLY